MTYRVKCENCGLEVYFGDWNDANDLLHSHEYRTGHIGTLLKD